MNMIKAYGHFILTAFGAWTMPFVSLWALDPAGVRPDSERLLSPLGAMLSHNLVYLAATQAL